jgi:hypothetical protein
MTEMRRTVLPPDQGIQRELQYLYTRRSTIDALIQSLEKYDQSRALLMERRRGTVRPLRHSLRIA